MFSMCFKLFFIKTMSGLTCYIIQLHNSMLIQHSSSEFCSVLVRFSFWEASTEHGFGILTRGIINSGSFVNENSHSNALLSWCISFWLAASENCLVVTGELVLTTSYDPQTQAVFNVCCLRKSEVCQETWSYGWNYGFSPSCKCLIVLRLSLEMCWTLWLIVGFLLNVCG